MKPPILARTALTLGLAALMPACSSSGSPEPLSTPVQTRSIGEGALQAVYPAQIRHSITGDMTLEVDTEGFVDVYEIFGGQFPEGVSHLTASVGFGALSLDDQGVMRWSADLVPGQYEGPGEYELDGERPPDLGSQSGIRSAAYFSIVGPSAGPAGAATYNVLVEPCILTYAKDAVTGELVCPSLGMEGDPDRTIEWTWTWERLPASKQPTPSFPPGTTPDEPTSSS